jgi:hypothetical protein
MSKLKAIDPKTAEPSKSKILVYGKPGVGKTWTSLDFPSVYYIDTEGGANLSHYTDKLKKSGGVYFGPEQGSQDFGEVVAQLKALATEEHPYRTVIIDSLSKIYNNEIAAEMDRLGDKDAFGASKKPAVRHTRQLINWIDRIDMNVILICHEKTVWANGEQAGVTFDAWEKLEYELHLCLNIQKMGNARKARISKSRLEAFQDAQLFDWSYDEFAKLYGREILEGKSKVLVLATPQQVEEIKYLVDLLKIDPETTAKWMDKAKSESWAEMEASKIQACIDLLKKKLNPEVLKPIEDKKKAKVA